MKVLLLNGSCHEKGCTFTALSEVSRSLAEEGVQTEILQIGSKPTRDCIGCGGCVGKGKCVFSDDVVNDWIAKAGEADGFVFGSPVYFAHPDGRILSVMDRLFYAGKKSFEHKPGAVISVARRAGTTASLDALSKHLTIAQMPVVSSSYWNMAFGKTPEEVVRDEEGMNTMYNLGKNMAWLLKCIDCGKRNGVAPPENNCGIKTDFIR